MGNYENLKQSITEVIRTNGNQEITGAVLQSTLLTIISTVGANATFAGIATPATNPGTPDGPVFYLASESGTYTNFNGIELQDGLSVLMWNGSWSGQQIFGIDDEPTVGSDNLVKSGGVQEELALGTAYDVSAKNPTAGPNNDGKFESLSALLGDANLNTLIPVSVRKGGMSIKFVQSSDNKYVQYMCKTSTWSSNPTDWDKEISSLVENSFTKSDLDIGDTFNNILASFIKGHIRTKNFESWNIILENLSASLQELITSIVTENDPYNDISICDENGNYLLILNGGHLRTKNFESDSVNLNNLSDELEILVTNIIVEDDSNHDFSVADENGNYILIIKGGNIRTKYFDSKNFDTESIVPFILPSVIYSVCNDLSPNLHQFSVKMYIDHLFRGQLEADKDINTEGLNYIPFYSKYNDYQSYINSTQQNTTKDIDTVTVNKILRGHKCDDFPISITHISTRNKASENAHCRLLCIGDSVTFGTGADKNMVYSDGPKQYWAWIKLLFELDYILNNNSGYDFVSLGNVLNDAICGATFNINVNGVTKNNIKAFACGVGGTTTGDWLNPTITGGFTITNPFYDIVNNRFSLRYWVENYRTIIVNNDGTTTRCTSVNKGPLAPNDTEINNVCEPTHVLIQLGYNESYSDNGNTRTNYLAHLRTMIETIQSEYPNIVIMLSLPDTAGTYFPQNYPEYFGEGNDIYSLDFNRDTARDSHNSFSFMNKDLQNLANEYNAKVMYAPTYFVSPLCDGAQSREQPVLAGINKNLTRLQYNISQGALPNLHPNNVAHACWAYEIYSMIKYTLIEQL